MKDANDMSAADAPMNPTTPARTGPNEEDRAPMTFTVRVFIYLVGVHFIAAFLFFLFYVAGGK
ncbi:hypothetical protein TPA0910_65220 [Streptomyces hygroscopicus subsp. sporocinereus]|uniref:Small hydrophobic protein n=1 Tax=Streptomyces hygroscopicus TaxID=1912 RepID=A0ABQ3U905_STRHY|nr:MULTISPECIES: DUF6126 family protein [Streptomyces]MDN3056384.1 DUF6126 family protein [Streptomyces sp. SRF1]GHJ32089.1 hypothetical protein TPA0910_65220 [Streptomyces hygroscopicus]